MVCRKRPTAGCAVARHVQRSEILWQTGKYRTEKYPGREREISVRYRTGTVVLVLQYVLLQHLHYRCFCEAHTVTHCQGFHCLRFPEERNLLMAARDASENVTSHGSRATSCRDVEHSGPGTRCVGQKALAAPPRTLLTGHQARLGLLRNGLCRGGRHAGNKRRARRARGRKVCEIFLQKPLARPQASRSASHFSLFQSETTVKPFPRPIPPCCLRLSLS